MELNIYFNHTVNKENFGVSGAFQTEKLALQFKNHGFRWTAGLSALEVFGRCSVRGGTGVTNVNKEHKRQRSGRTLSVHMRLCSLPCVKTTRANM